MIATLPGLLLLGYVLLRPVSNGQVLYPVLAGLTAFAAIDLLRRPAGHVRQRLLTIGYALLAAAIIATTVGSINDTPGLGHQAAVWLGSIAVWGTWAASLDTRAIRRTLLTVTIATAVLSGMIIAYVAAQKGLIPQALPDSLYEAQGAGYAQSPAGEGVRLYGLSTLAGAGPLVMAGVVLGRSPLMPPRWLLVVAASLALAASLVSGRRAITIVILAAPLVALALTGALRPRTERRRVRIHPAWVIGSPALFAGTLWVSGTGAADRARVSINDAAALYLGIGTTSTLSTRDDAVRHQQAGHLIDAWGDNPMFGAGLGAVLPNGFTRSPTRPWTFELQYHQWLFTAGLVGAVLLATALVVGWRSVRAAAASSPQHLPTLTAVATTAVCMLAANTSNPYSQAVGHGWMVALVLGVANALTSRPVHEPPRSLANPHPSRGDRVRQGDRGPSRHAERT